MTASKTLMQIGKLSLEIDSYYMQDTLQFKHEEIQQDPWYGNEVVETEISKKDAVELIKHLKEFYNIQE